jgi:transposase
VRSAWRPALDRQEAQVHFIGIDPHKDTLAACAVDPHGRPVSHASFPNDPAGYADLVPWALAYRPDRIGVEGAGGLGRQATLALQRSGLTVVEVPPQLTAQARRRGRSQAKTDPIDALLIARITLRDANLPTVRGDGPLEALRSLVDYRRELLGERTRLSNRLHADLEQLRPGYQRRLPKLAHPATVDRARRLLADDARTRAQIARQRLTRLRQLHTQIAELTTQITQLVQRFDTALTQICGIAAVAEAELLAEVGDISRYGTKAQFAMSNGTAPLPVSSGRTNRHRLNRGGNRQLNRILHYIALTQIARDPQGRAYYHRKLAEGRTKPDALRCLKRRISDRVYQTLRRQPPAGC